MRDDLFHGRVVDWMLIAGTDLALIPQDGTEVHVKLAHVIAWKYQRDEDRVTLYTLAGALVIGVAPAPSGVKPDITKLVNILRQQT